MADTILIEAALRIERPIDEVRAQFRDIDHHIRSNVHPSIAYQWEPDAPAGERRIRTSFKVLGLPQFDVAVLEDAPDGTFVIRHIEGTNAGMVVVHAFEPIGDDATEVRLSATAPATLGRKILGPLFVIGARQVMKKALMEDKRDLEKGAFKANVAQGNVERALEKLAPIADMDPKARSAVADAANLVSSCDGDIDTVERNALARLEKIIRAPGGLRPVPADVAKEAERIGAALKTLGVVEEGVRAGAVVGLVSHGMSLGELEVLRRIATTAGMDEEAVGAIVEAADAALMA